jgi:hypothetical protein
LNLQDYRLGSKYPELIPHAYSQHVLGELHYQGANPLEEDEGLTMPNYNPKDNFFLQLVHVALKIPTD